MSQQMAMTFQQLIRSALPAGASDDDVEYVLWNRTPFPFETNPQILFKKARGYVRACQNGIQQCELCHRPARPGKWDCQQCDDAINAAR